MTVGGITPWERNLSRERTIDDLRGDIDRIDGQLVDLLNERARLAVLIGERKRENRKSFYHPAREKQVLEGLAKRNHGPLDTDRLRLIFREVMSACLSLEKPLRIACLGPLGTFSHEAVREQFGAHGEVVPVASIADVFDEVEHGRTDYGVVPVENSTEGVVTATLDRFVDSSATIKAEIQLRIEHCLLVARGRRRPIERIVSHPQSLGQCRQWLRQNHPLVELIEMSSNAAAAERAANEPGTAAIAGRLAARLHRLRIEAENIQDLADNFTRFLVIGRDEHGPPSGDDKTSLLLSAPHEAGALHRILQPFAHHQVSLCSIESRPLRGRPWEYVFFLDLVGHVDEPAVARALAAVRRRCLKATVLGSYPAASRPS